jgi:hypothetical protein
MVFQLNELNIFEWKLKASETKELTKILSYVTIPGNATTVKFEYVT